MQICHDVTIFMLGRLLSLKKGESYINCQDSIEFQNKRTFRFAIADGVSQSSFPNIWSKILVDTFCKNGIAGFRKIVSKKLQSLSSQWESKRSFSKDSKIPSFFQKRVLANPGSSTFVGLQIFNVTKHKSPFFINAVGDSCFFHFRNGTFKDSFPQKKSKEFSGVTTAISTNTKTVDLEKYKGEAIWNDTLVLATDALAKWLMTQIENNEEGLIEELLSVKDQKEFYEFVKKYRTAEKDDLLDNDDTTLLIVDIKKHSRPAVMCGDNWKTSFDRALKNKLEISTDPPLESFDVIEEQETPTPLIQKPPNLLKNIFTRK